MNRQRSNRTFKRLTPENWLVRDSTLDYFSHVHPDGRTSQISDDVWVQQILTIELSPAVPQDVRELFEVAQGVLCYGCFFYPLYTLGNEQVYRVLEAALSHRCADLGLFRKSNRFMDNVNLLLDHGSLGEQRCRQWDAARELRNSASHASRQNLMTPPMAVDGLQTAADLIEDLFGKQGSTELQFKRPLRKL